MNHIHRLTQERDEAVARLAAIEQRQAEFLAHMQTPKFTNPGPLQNYINVNDVQRWLRYVNNGDSA